MGLVGSNFKDAATEPRKTPEGRMDISGEKYGNLTVLGFWELKDATAHWLCQCDCGKKLTVRHGNVRAGLSTKCSDCRDSKLREVGCNNRTHGLSRTPVNSYWYMHKHRFVNEWKLDLTAFNEQCFKKRPKPKHGKNSVCPVNGFHRCDCVRLDFADAETSP